LTNDYDEDAEDYKLEEKLADDDVLANLDEVICFIGPRHHTSACIHINS